MAYRRTGLFLAAAALAVVSASCVQVKVHPTGASEPRDRLSADEVYAATQVVDGRVTVALLLHNDGRDTIRLLSVQLPGGPGNLRLTAPKRTAT